MRTPRKPLLEVHRGLVASGESQSIGARGLLQGKSPGVDATALPPSQRCSHSSNGRSLSTPPRWTSFTNGISSGAQATACSSSISKGCVTAFLRQTIFTTGFHQRQRRRAYSFMTPPAHLHDGFRRHPASTVRIIDLWPCSKLMRAFTSALIVSAAPL